MTPRDANALAGLRAAREYLWKGGDASISFLSETVCGAAKKARMHFVITGPQLDDTFALLGKAMNATGNKTLMEWIAENGGAEWLETATDRDKQQVRHLWLEQLISDLEARG